MFRTGLEVYQVTEYTLLLSPYALPSETLPFFNLPTSFIPEHVTLPLITRGYVGFRVALKRPLKTVIITTENSHVNRNI